MLLVLLFAVPALVALLTIFVRALRLHVAVLLVIAVAHLGGTALLWTGGPDRSLGALLDLDVTGLLFLSLTSVLFLAASIYSVPYVLDGTHDKPAAPHRYVPCLLWFLAAMTLVCATQHLALLWAAVEGTTLASAPLVFFYRRRAALEATWKYLLLCSVGIALALLGTFFLGIAATAAPAGHADLTMEALTAVAPAMSRPWLTGAFVLAVVGYGTKMGLAPLHTWLPDTHSQAPSPVSALLSGALLNCAFLAILRFYQVCLAAGDAGFARDLLLVLGFASLGVACAFMIGQGDYKRLFAYSSIENMGILAIGIGLGGAASYGAMLHAVNHSVVKAGLFFLAGNLLRAFGSTSIKDVRGVFRRLPATGILLAVLLLAIGGLPPFGPFWSELIIFEAALSSGRVWLGVLFVVLIAVAFLGMAGAMLPMLQGSPTDRPAPERPHAVMTPLAMAGATLLLGVWVPPFLGDALHEAAGLLGGLP